MKDLLQNHCIIMITSNTLPENNGGELLTLDAAPTPLGIPFDEISFSTGSDGAAAQDEEASVVSAISDQEDDENCAILGKNANHHSSLAVDGVPRSIFSSYWKDDYTSRDPVSCSTRTRKRTVILDKIHQGQNPYVVFGIQHPHKQDQKGEVDSSSSSSLNTYERMLQDFEYRTPSRAPSHSTIPRSPFESRPLWMSLFSGKQYLSEPQLLSSVNASHTARVNRSDTVLVKKPSKSCLRRGRFATAALQSPKMVAHPNTIACLEAPPLTSPGKVCFQPKIEVHVFQPPVEQWSPSGWSSLFG
jgi:hypothetical protein